MKMVYQEVHEAIWTVQVPSGGSLEAARDQRKAIKDALQANIVEALIAQYQPHQEQTL
jgi:hypothetical protein